MASFTEANATRLSTATLTDPKSLRKHLANGNPPISSLLPARRGSEPPRSEFPFEMPFVPDSTRQQSKDDAYHVLENKGKKTFSSPNSTTAGQAASDTFDPRHLLDPRGFKNDQRQRNSMSASTGSSSHQPTHPNRQLESRPFESNEEPYESNENGLHKRDREDYEGQGMGNMIERMHNVSQREERPQKKSKVENDEFDIEDDNKVRFVGGGKGGEIGEYLKEKKKQGIAESGPVSAVVDLTGGTYHLSKHSIFGHGY